MTAAFQFPHHPEKRNRPVQRGRMGFLFGKLDPIRAGGRVMRPHRVDLVGGVEADFDTTLGWGDYTPRPPVQDTED